MNTLGVAIFTKIILSFAIVFAYFTPFDTILALSEIDPENRFVIHFLRYSLGQQSESYFISYIVLGY